MKHRFPENKDVYCNEKHTLEQAKEFILMAKIVGLEIGEEVLEDPVDKKYPYLFWDGYEKLITQYADEGDFTDDTVIDVSFDEFKKFLGPISNTRLEIEKLFATI